MRNSRYILFGVALAVGIGLGLLYGWVLSPVELVDTTPATLRIDYKADFVLMVAEAYAVEQDPGPAVCRLALLGYPDPASTIEDAVVFAVQQTYAPADLVLMRELGSALETWEPTLETCEP